jgi:hypothetical protein
VGHRIQGVVLNAQPAAAAVESIAALYPTRVFELAGAGVWLLDLAFQPAPNRDAIRFARSIAASYVDAVRVLDGDEHELEQLGWLVASTTVARLVDAPVLGFVSDDVHLDFATIARPDGVTAIADHVPPYLIRFEPGQLAIQPYLRSPKDGVPNPPEELGLIASVSLLPAEPLQGGYPLHGNVVAEMYEFAPSASGLVGDDAAAAGARKALRLVEARGLDASCWDA